MDAHLPGFEHVFNIWFHQLDGDDFKELVSERAPRLLEEDPAELTARWNTSPEGRLALILLYDQTPRLLFEDGRAYAYDLTAQELTTLFWEDHTYLSLTAQQQMLAFFPYHHAENALYQSRARPHFDVLGRQDAKFEWIAKSSGNYNRIIERFGRFPHRNEVLGRETTYEEWDFLVTEYYEPKDLVKLKQRGVLPKQYWDSARE